MIDPKFFDWAKEGLGRCRMEFRPAAFEMLNWTAAGGAGEARSIPAAVQPHKSWATFRVKVLTTKSLKLSQDGGFHSETN